MSRLCEPVIIIYENSYCINLRSEISSVEGRCRLKVADKSDQSKFVIILQFVNNRFETFVQLSAALIKQKVIQVPLLLRKRAGWIISF